MKDFLSPRQAGIGISVYLEAIVHSTRRFIHNMPADHVVFKLEFSNAFNSLHRDYILRCVADTIPESYTFCYTSYNVDSKLQFGDFIILSLVGPQQGDHLSELLFCLGIHQILQYISSPFSAGLFHDIALGANESVVTDIKLIKSKSCEIGLILNISKCKVINPLTVQFPTIPKFHSNSTSRRLLSRHTFKQWSIIGSGSRDSIQDA